MEIKIQPAYFFAQNKIRILIQIFAGYNAGIFLCLEKILRKNKKIFKFVGTFLLFNLVLYMKGQSVSKNILQKSNQKTLKGEENFENRKQRSRIFGSRFRK